MSQRALVMTGLGLTALIVLVILFADALLWR
jgi:hypothetical protein